MEESKILESIKEVKEWVAKMQADIEENGPYLYRGQGDSSWDLKSTYARNGDLNNSLGRLKYYFEEKIKTLKDEFIKLESLEILSKMQHFGQKTPLIDFTEDILVALWFAISYEPELNNDEPKSFRIFYKERDIKDEKNELNFNDIKNNKITTLKLKTGSKIRRSIIQKSVFIFDTLDLTAKFEFKDIKNDFKLKIKIKNWLEGMGISMTTLFPDEEGIYRSFDVFSANNYFSKGLNLIYWEKYDESVKMFEKTIELDPKYAPAYNNWGYTLNELNRSEEAIEKFEKAIELDPKYALAHNNWGVSLAKLNKLEEAIEKFEKAIELDPKYEPAYNNWGVALSKLNKPKEAIEKFEETIEKFEKAIELDPNCADAYNNLKSTLDRLLSEGKIDEKKHQDELNKIKYKIK